METSPIKDLHTTEPAELPEDRGTAGEGYIVKTREYTIDSSMHLTPIWGITHTHKFITTKPSKTDTKCQKQRSRNLKRVVLLSFCF